jgi:hypothetical protein
MNRSKSFRTINKLRHDQIYTKVLIVKSYTEVLKILTCAQVLPKNIKIQAARNIKYSLMEVRDHRYYKKSSP